MNDTKYKDRILSFSQLLKENRIEIPIIQRDYAQGREDKEEIRTNFLKALYQSIKENKSIKLDFIYGSNIENAFQPLDGQQRLTTLFLLHWYAATKDKVLNEANISLLNKFSYETRITSRDFCKALITNPISINSASDKISLQIIDSSWFYLSWKKDPTIDSMLRTIDDINKHFFNYDRLWEKLVSEDSPISFYYVELENIGLTDDLYIKMNARGKLLSSFENFKASFQKYINDRKLEDGISPTETFAFKIDTKWTDYFWHHFRKDNSIDEAFIRFITTVAMIRQSIEKSEDRIETITRLQENPNNIRPELFSEGGFKYLKDCFEIYSKVFNEEIDIIFKIPLWRHKPKTSLLSEIVYENNLFGQLNSASYSQKVLFFAQTEYLTKVETFNSDNFQDWLRVVRNIVSRGSIERNGNRPDIIRSPQSFDGVINLISELSEGCEDIYNYLSTKDKLTSLFAKDQIDEEKIKAKLITKDISNKKVLFDTEDNDLFMGRIEFAFYCCDFDGNIENFDKVKFTNIQKIATEHFQKETPISNELRRALLTIEVDGRYEYYGYWRSFWHVVSANKRCLIDNFREVEYYIHNVDYREYFKKLIIKLIVKDLKEIIRTFEPPSDIPNWKIRLIKETDLLDTKSKSNYIAIPDDNSCCYLLRSMRPRDLAGCEKIE